MYLYPSSMVYTLCLLKLMSKTLEAVTSVHQFLVVLYAIVQSHYFVCRKGAYNSLLRCFSTEQDEALVQAVSFPLLTHKKMY